MSGRGLNQREKEKDPRPRPDISRYSLNGNECHFGSLIRTEKGVFLGKVREPFAHLSKTASICASVMFLDVFFSSVFVK